jgi:cobalt/nickel transport system permease protein
MFFSPAPMHIPDSFLSLAVSIVCWVITALTLAVAISRTNQSLGERQIPLMGVMAAFIFAAQMINFPVAGGTSGHLLGGALAAIMLGPWAAMLVMTAVIAVQGLLFQDGGLVVMGANILNMGLLTAVIGFGLYRAVLGQKRGAQLVVAGLAAWLSVMAGALMASLELWVSGTAKLAIVLPAMLGVHTLIGIGEAAITVATLAFIFRTRPDLLNQTPASAQGGRGWIVVGVLISLAVVLLAPLASTNPDGLNRVAMDIGFISSTPSPAGPLAGYHIPFLQGASGKIVSGAIGAVVVLVVAITVGLGLRKKKES